MKCKDCQNYCKCGFKFSGPGEFRNCAAFITKEGKSGVVCPKCQRAYIDGREVVLEKESKKREVADERR